MRTTLKFKSNEKFCCSIKLISSKGNEYNYKLNKFIVTLLKSDEALILNNFGMKYLSFAQVTAGKEVETKQKAINNAKEFKNNNSESGNGTDECNNTMLMKMMMTSFQ